MSITKLLPEDFIAEYVAAAGNYVYVAGDTSAMQVVDVSNPATPQLRGTFSTAGSAEEPMITAGHFVYEPSHDEGDLQVVNVSNPSAPYSAGSFIIGEPIVGVALTGNYALVLQSGDSNKLIVLKVE